jgi:ribonuclease BN (tRNA processing enzyme)
MASSFDLRAFRYFVAVAAACLTLILGPSRGASQPTSGPLGIKLVTLGTHGGPVPDKDRAQSSNLLVVNGTVYLIDAGDGVARRIVQAGYSYLKPRKIFITHDHSDHTLGLAVLLIDQWEQAPREVTDVYGPPGTEAFVRDVRQLNTVNAEIRYSEGKAAPMAGVHAHDVATGEVYRDANVTVTAVENTHFQIGPGDPGYGKYKSYAYRFQTANGSIVFTGDTGPSDAVTALAKGADVLVSEIAAPSEIVAQFVAAGIWQNRTPAEQAGFVKHMQEEHLTPDAVANMATKAGVKNVVLTHLSGWTPGNQVDDFARFGDQVRKSYAGHVFVAKDLMVFAF